MAREAGNTHRVFPVVAVDKILEMSARNGSGDW
jgi:hypothetical protein